MRGSRGSGSALEKLGQIIPVQERSQRALMSFRHRYLDVQSSTFG
jgi:hypothetical protein